jgi:hypothetical protein
LAHPLFISVVEHNKYAKRRKTCCSISQCIFISPFLLMS